MKKRILTLLALSLLAVQLTAQPVITSQPTNQFAVFGSNTMFSVMVTGVGPFVYQWRLNGTNLPNGINRITRFAGGSGNSFAGDGGLAVSAALAHPSGLAIDAAGSFFLADYFNNRIRKVNTNGIITTIAGIGPSNQSGNYSGDGGLATNAALNLPYGIAVDSAGNIYFSDSFNSRIRKVDTNGIIATIAGTNTFSFSGDGGPAANAKLNEPSGVTMDGGGNLLIADKKNSRIRKINTNGIITTVVGTNSLGFSGDGGLAVNAQLYWPSAVAVDGLGNTFIADTLNNRIRKIDTNGIITTYAGNGSSGFSGDGGAATNASLAQPDGVAVDAFNDVFIADYANNRVRMVNTAGTITTVAGTGNVGSSGDGGFATNANLYHPSGLVVDVYRNVYLTDDYTSEVRKLNSGGMPMLQLNNVVATNAGNYDVIITNSSGSVTSSIVSLTLFFPPGIIVQPTAVTQPVGGSASFNVSVSGDAPLSYQWFTSSGNTATAVPVVSGGRVFSATITSGGAGYSTAPQVNFIGGSGSGAFGTASVNNGAVTSISIISQGSGYTTPPTIQIGNPSLTSNTLLSDQTNASLTLLAVTRTDATNYFVMVTNNYGTVTSAMVALTVFLSPQNFTAQNVVTGLQMQLTGSPNYPYIIQSATNLTPPISWKSIRTNNADANGNWQFTDTNLDAGQKFYRALGR